MCQLITDPRRMALCPIGPSADELCVYLHLSSVILDRLLIQAFIHTNTTSLIPWPVARSLIV
jgi:hypothetical protein